MIKACLFAGLNSRQMVPAAGTCMIVTRPQIPFRPLRFWVDPDRASDFIIHAIYIGVQIEGFVNSESVPAAMFSTVRDNLPALDAVLERDGIVKVNVEKKALEVLGLDIAFPSMIPGQDFTVMVQNISGQARMFRGAIIGIPGE